MTKIFFAVLTSFLWLTELSAQSPSEANLYPLTTVELDSKIILANTIGLTVYTFDPDEPGRSNCHNSCSKVWPPVLTTEIQELMPPISYTQRNDGTFQVTYKDHPLYTFIGDHALGDTKGDGLNGVWHTVQIDN